MSFLDWSDGGSGYNEVIINSAKYNAHLPDVVDAFFVMKGHSTTTQDDADHINVNVQQAHGAFLHLYNKSALEVPLLVFDPFNWDQPFSVFEGSQ